MRLVVLSVPAMLALAGVLWCAWILQRIPDDWLAYREEMDANQRRWQVALWVGSAVVGVATLAGIVAMWGVTAAEWESWKRSF